MATLRLDRITVALRAFELDLSLEVGSTLALVGPSGAGKTTVLRAVAGLARPQSGRIAIGDDVLFDGGRGVDLPPERRRVGLVFQEYALFPHMTVRQNVAYGGEARAAEMMERLHLAHLAGARPPALSGGERQRVALARALAREPGVLLLDEPLSALDPHTKSTVRAELATLLADLGLPTLVVTHDYDDAVALAGTVGVLVTGELRQLGAPQELLDRPADAFVAAFTGANLLRGRATARHGALTEVVLEGGGVLRSTDRLDGDVDVVIHPWELSIDPAAGRDGDNEITAPIRSLTPVGGRVRALVGPVMVELPAAAAAALGLAPGIVARARFAPAATRLIARR